MRIAYRNRPPDLSRQEEDSWFAYLRGLTPAEKAQIMTRLNRAAEEVALAEIRARHPGASAFEVRCRMLSLRLDRDAMIRFFDWDPDRAGLDPPLPVLWACPERAAEA